MVNKKLIKGKENMKSPSITYRTEIIKNIDKKYGVYLILFTGNIINQLYIYNNLVI